MKIFSLRPVILSSGLFCLFLKGFIKQIYGIIENKARTTLFYFFLIPAIVGLNGTCNLFAQLSFIHITDMHVSNATSYVNGCDLNGQLAHCYFNEFANLNPKPAFVIATGDISNIGNQSAFGFYPVLTQYLYPGQMTNPGPGAYFIDSALTIPIYFTPGNHEYYTTLTPPLSSSITYYSIFVSPDSDYMVTTDYAVLICMRSGQDAMRPVWQDPNVFTLEGSGLSNAQCIWLRNKLSLAGNKRKIIAMHHPIVNVHGTNSDGTPNTGTIWDDADGSVLNNRNTFMNICDSNQVDIVLGGHIHQNVVASRAGNVVSENWTGGTRYIQTSAAQYHAYREITVSPSFVSVSLPLQSCITTDFSRTENQCDVKVFPNPNHGKFYVSGCNLKRLEIYNIFAVKILETSNPEEQTSNEIDLSKYTPGIYFVKIYDGVQITTQKIVIQ